MRSRGWSLTRAARENHTEIATVRRYVGTALRRDRSRRHVPKPVDRLVRRLLVHTEQGDEVLDLTDSRQATLIAEHANALRQFGRTGDLVAGIVHGTLRLALGTACQVRALPLRLLSSRDSECKQQFRARCTDGAAHVGTVAPL